MPRYEMDAAYASVMREEGISYKEIGKEIARREGRLMAYQAPAVWTAIRTFLCKLEADGFDEAAE